jgi:hypothetical protein
VQGHVALVDGCYLGADGAILPRRDDPEQFPRSSTALGRYNAEFGQVSAQGIA